MFQVFDNGNPADHRFNKTVSTIWGPSHFDSFNAALIYARQWLWPYGGEDASGLTGIVLHPNTPYDYSGYGDFIEIREVENPI